MASTLKDRILSVLMVSTLMLIVVIGIIMITPKYRKAELLKQQNAELQEEIDRKKREISYLNECQMRFKSDADFVEMIARQNRRVYPGELVFTFEKE